jgi:hypothetical protein
MTDKKKIDFLEGAMVKLYQFSTFLNKKNLEAFEDLKIGISNALNEEERIRFNQIDFHNEEVDFKEIMDDDLPF